MALNYVTLTVDVYDGQGNYPTSGTASFTPTVVLTDTTNHEIIDRSPVVVSFKASGVPTVKLLATDNSTALPAGWAWTVTFSDPNLPAAYNFFLAFANGASQNLSAISAVSTAVTQFPLNPMTTKGDIIYGDTGGTPLRLGIGTAGQVLEVVNGLPVWSTGGGGFSNPMTTLGDLIIENATPAPARLAGPTAAGTWLFTSTPSAGVAQAPAWAQGVTLSGYLAPAVVTLTDAAQITVDASKGNSFAVTLTASGHTLANPTNPVDGQAIRVRVIQDATGSRTLAYGTAYDFGAVSAPTLSTGANKVDILGFEYVASLAKWAYLGSGLGF